MDHEMATDWGEAARLYGEGRASVRELASRLGVSTSTIYRKARDQGWRRPVRKGGKTSKTVTPADARIEIAAPDANVMMNRSADTGTIYARLYKALDCKLAIVEARIAHAVQSKTGIPAAQSERDARTLSSLVRLFEKLRAMDVKEAATTGRRGSSEGTSLSPKERTEDDDRFRRELIRRIKALRKQGDSR